MASDRRTAVKSNRFGKCCQNMAEVMAPHDFDPLIAVGDDGVLYMTVGTVAINDASEEEGLVEHPIYFCPFCGAKLQNPEDFADDDD